MSGAEGTPRPEDVRRVREELWELAQGVSRYLRRHASPAVRLATALLLAASLAACNASASDPTVVDSPAVAPLQQEVSTGLPRAPGRYPVVPGSVFRDQKGVYQMDWLEPGQATAPQGAAPNVAHVSRLRLARDEPLSLEIVDGQDPVLHLPEGENIGLIEDSQPGTSRPANSGSNYHPTPYGFWSPFTIGYLLGSNRPAYYDPPRTVVVSDPSGGAGTVPRVEGGSVSETAKPPAQRVTGVRSAVSGRAGGTGAGSAVTGRNVGSGVSQAPAGASGSTGSTGGTSASSGASTSGSRPSGGASASSGSSGSAGGGGVTAPRSGGFSSGTGSSGGSAAS
jgi:hypothetical protein